MTVTETIRHLSVPDARARLVLEERRLLLDATERDDWQGWLEVAFGKWVAGGFAPHHGAFWRWVWALEPAVRPDAFIAIWPRGGAKSTSAELAVVMVAARQARRYGLYVCETQDQADDHVANVGSILESPIVDRQFPELGQRLVGKFGNSKGWRRNRLRTAAGFTLDALGLDTASRGVKLDDQRPDLMVFDDLDGEHDSAATVERKVETLTRALIPAGAEDLAVLAIQNLVHPESIFARLADGRADFLGRRHVSGPIPALEQLAVDMIDGRPTITAGVPTWDGMGVERCQAMLDDMGLAAFLAECQHDTTVRGGGMFDHLTFRHCAPEEVPDLLRVEVWVDPAVTNTDSSDAHGVQADGLAPDGTIYRLRSWERRATPLEALRVAIGWAFELGSSSVGVETDQGGDTWQSVYREALTAVLAEHPEWRGRAAPTFRSEKAGAGHGPKAHRASQMLPDYEQGRIVHVLGTHGTLEAALRRFPKTKPFDLVDCAFWGWRALRTYGQPARSHATSVASARIDVIQATRR